MDPLTPKSHGEEVAVFRHGLIGAIALRSLWITFLAPAGG